MFTLVGFFCLLYLPQVDIKFLEHSLHFILAEKPHKWVGQIESYNIGSKQTAFLIDVWPNYYHVGRGRVAVWGRDCSYPDMDLFPDPVCEYRPIRDSHSCHALRLEVSGNRKQRRF